MNTKISIIFSLILILINLSVFAENTEKETEKKIIEKLNKLKESMNKNDFGLLENLLDENYTVPGVPQDYSKNVIKQVINSYSKKITGYQIVSIEKEDKDYRVNTEFQKEDENSEYDFLLSEDFQFKEINIFRVETKKAEKAKEENLDIPIFMQVNFEMAGKLILVEAELNGVKGNFLLDSGAPSLVINSKQEIKNNNQTSLGSMGVSGSISNMDVLDVELFKWNDYSIKDFSAISMDLSHLEDHIETPIMGLIGQIELEPFETSFDYENQMLLMFKLNENGEKFAKVQGKKASLEIPFQLNSHIPVFDCVIGGKEIKFGLDTGAETNLIAQNSFDKFKNNFEETDSDTLSGANKGKVIVPSGIINQTMISGKNFDDMNAIVSDISHLNLSLEQKIDGLLGYEFLSKQRTAINYRKKILYVW